jgi:hypothetical protein
LDGDAKALGKHHRRHAMNAIEAPPQMLRLCAACATFMPNARGETAYEFQPKSVP